MTSARGLFRATGKTARPVMTDLLDGEAVWDSAPARRANDFYPTPPEPTRAILRAERERLQGFRCIWEPAAGDGAMAREILAAGMAVAMSDLVDRGARAEIRSFYDYTRATAPSRAILTNPPFVDCNSGAWIRHALEALDCEYLALLLPVNWMGSGKVRAKLWADHTPARVYLMRWRIDFSGGGAPPMLNAWYVWDRSAAPGTQLLMLDRADARQGELSLGSARNG